jgi:hypothetical protein
MTKNKYWFSYKWVARWGHIPIIWEGYLVFPAFILIFFIPGIFILPNHDKLSDPLVWLTIAIFVLDFVAFILLNTFKAEPKPKKK